MLTILDPSKATYSQVLQVLITETTVMGINQVHSLFQINIIDLKAIPNPYLSDEEGYVFDTSVIDYQIEGKPMRYFYVFFRNGTVDIRVNDVKTFVARLPTWDSGFASIFARTAETLLFFSKEMQTYAQTAYRRIVREPFHATGVAESNELTC